MNGGVRHQAVMGATLRPDLLDDSWLLPPQHQEQRLDVWDPSTSSQLPVML